MSLELILSEYSAV